MTSEEKSFLEWMKATNISAKDILIIKKAYIDGFKAGIEKKLQYSAEEQLQK